MCLVAHYNSYGFSLCTFSVSEKATENINCEYKYKQLTVQVCSLCFRLIYSFFFLCRKHHWLWDLHLPQRRPGALGLRGAGAGGVVTGRLHRCPRIPLLRWTGSDHPQIWRRLFLCHRDFRGSDGVRENSVLVCTEMQKKQQHYIEG